MDKNLNQAANAQFYGLKVLKKKQLTKNTFFLELEIPEKWKTQFYFKAGQFVPIKYLINQQEMQDDFSITAAPFEDKLSFGIKVNSEESATHFLINNLKEGDLLEVGAPKGRFTLVSKPHEHRTILGFASGIGITPILSHIKQILHTEKRSTFYLFFGNKKKSEIPFKEELDFLEKEYKGRLQIFYFFTEEHTENPLFFGRLDERKLNLIINQILTLNEDDEESTLWDETDHVLICGPGEMIKSLANAIHNHGISKKCIHFELFEAYNEDIYPVEKVFPLIENIKVDFTLYNKCYSLTIEDNKTKLLQKLLILGYPVPYSCKSGICGSCECNLEKGKVELLENEYLTKKEEKQGRILACQSVVLSKEIKINFDIY